MKNEMSCYIETDHPLVGHEVSWTSRNKTKEGKILFVIKNPKIDNIDDYSIQNERKRKEQFNKIRNYRKSFIDIKSKLEHSHTISFKTFGVSVRKGSHTFIVEVEGEKENHKPKLLHPYAHRLTIL